MPTYEYRCRECGEQLEVVQSFTDDPLDTCPSCGGSLRKVFAAPGISFKGSGFYKTDSKGGSSSTVPSGSGASGTGDGGSGSDSAGSSTSGSTSTSGDKAASTASTGSGTGDSGSGSSSSSGTKEAAPA
jgi:putative FmdB family regulatory protein